MDAFETKGLVSRHRERPDRRLVQVTPTEKDARVHRQAVAGHEPHLQIMLDRLPPAMRETLLPSLSVLRSAAEAMAPPPGAAPRSRERD